MGHSFYRLVDVHDLHGYFIRSSSFSDNKFLLCFRHPLERFFCLVFYFKCKILFVIDNISYVFSVLYARLKNRTYFVMPLGVRPSVSLSLHSSVNFLFLDNSSYSLHLIKLKLDTWLDHDVEQGILF